MVNAYEGTSNAIRFILQFGYIHWMQMKHEHAWLYIDSN